MIQGKPKIFFFLCFLSERERKCNLLPLNSDPKELYWKKLNDQLNCLSMIAYFVFIFKKFFLPIFVAVISLYLEFYTSEYLAHASDKFLLLIRSYSIIFFRVVSVFAVASFVNNTIEIFFWDRLSKKKENVKIPKLLTDGTKTIVYFLAVLLSIHYALEKSIGGFITASGAVGIVIGFALRGIISDIFSGLVLNLDGTFQMNDWIIVNARGLNTIVGCIVEINWRSTQLKTTDNNIVILPNSLIAQNIVKNISRPEEKSRFELVFTLDFKVPYERAIRVLTAAALSAEGILKDPPPNIKAGNISTMGVEYVVRFWLMPSVVSPLKGRNYVIQSVLLHLHQAGLSLAYNKQDLFYQKMPQRNLDRNVDIQKLLERVELFKEMKREEIRFLERNIREISVPKGSSVVTIGDTSSTMFILVEGLLHVYIPKENEKEIFVGQILPGDYFGEMSLLTGQERSANVYTVTDSILFEVTKEAMNQLIKDRPSLMEELSNTIAARQTQNEKATPPIDPDTLSQKTNELAKSLLDKMKDFFNFF
jgi:small-conductance mechanosensitive channel